MRSHHSSVTEQLQQALNLHQQGQFANAKELYQAILVAQPEHFDALHLLGVLEAQTGYFDNAVRLMRTAIGLNNNHYGVYYNCGNALKENLQLQAAIECYSHAIALNPHYAEAYCSRGLVHSDLKQYSAALADFDKASALSPDFADVYVNRGNVLQELRDWQGALACYNLAISKKPDFALAYYNRGNALHKLSQLEAALNSYIMASKINPDYSHAFFNQGVILVKLQRLREALTCYSQALAIKADYIEAYCGRALVWQTLNQEQNALQDYAQALTINPDYVEAYNNRATLYANSGHLEQARHDYEWTLTLQPEHKEALSNYGNLMKDLRHLKVALASLEKAVQLDTEWADAHWNYALALLLNGELARGWQEQEWRWRCPGFPSEKRNFTQPLWLGKTAIAGKTLLLHTEQGMGDSLQFCRYVPFLKPLGAKLILEAERPLVTLFKSLDGEVTVLEKGQPLPAFDYHCPLLSLPLACGTGTLADIPVNVPYLFAPPTKVQIWRDRLGPKTKPRVGLVWSSGVRAGQNPLAVMNARRDIHFALIARLNRSDIDFYSLQKGQPAESGLITDKAQCWTSDNLHVLTDHLNDFSDTAALIMNLDLVISVCTSVTHLAGALGKTTWVLLPFSADWRWLVDRDDSPWYPTLRLFRQQQAGHWDSVITAVQKALENWLQERRNN